MTYLRTRDTEYNFDKVYYVNYDNFIYRLITDKKTLEGYLFYCDGTHFDSCTVNYTEMNITYKEQTLDILEAEVDNNGAFRFIGEVESFDKLPTNAINGDIYQVGDKEYVWNGSEWVELGFNIDLSPYAQITYVDSKTKVNADNITINAKGITENEKLINKEITERKEDVKNLQTSVNNIKTFVINLTEHDDGSYTADKPYTEIAAAYLNNQYLIVTVGEGKLPLLNAEINTTGASFTFGFTVIGTNGEYISTRTIHYLHIMETGVVEARDEWTEETLVEEYLKTSGGTLTGNLNMGANAILDVQKLHIDGQAPLYLGQVIEKATPNKPRLTGVVNSNAAAFVKSDSQVEYVPVFLGTPTDNNHATTKKYVDEAVGKKLTQNTDPSNDDRVYGVTVEGKQQMFTVAEDVTVNSIAKRNENGELAVNSPTDDLHAVNKQYLESALTDKQDTFAQVTTIDNESTMALNDDITQITHGNYAVQLSNGTFALSNTLTKKYLTFDNEGQLSLKNESGPIIPTDPSDIVTKKYVDDKVTANFAYDASTKTLTISV